ncbi:MAG: ABC transporter ATP-binding protein [Endomicrobium sp.]|jgi:ABC-2 type transport system ATP-binding protein|uniref:ABC transporter ATP-binding protein n=1 Tax=Candidatus Endomicrobiellum cubanum TaxID=3242325 RepID=UPI002816D201|nr:ABC transporter ATP-binding protein [Endomicrobium sp.]
MNLPIIEVKNLTIAFGNFKAVDDISFSVNKGEIFGFLGANGAGKTTTIRTLCGILTPTSGKIHVYGKDVSNSTHLIKNNIGYMSQKFTLYKDLSIKENLEFAGALYNMSDKKMKEETQKLFNFIDFKGDENTIVNNLPLGIKQMLSLCAAMLHNSDLIFLDEPTAGVAPKIRLKFWQLIKKLAINGKTIFITTHYMDEAEYSDRVVLMQTGKIVAIGTPKELKKQFFKTALYKITPKNGNFALLKEKIKSVNFASNINYYGNSIKFSVDDFEECQRFFDKEKNFIDYKIVQPSLEDVFIKAISRK